MAVTLTGSAAVDKPVPRYRFAAHPIVAMERDSSSGDYAFSVFARLNRSLPRDRFGAPRGELLVADSGGPAPISTIRRRTHCYVEPIDPSFTKSRVLRHPRPGRQVVVRLYLSGQLMDHTTVALSRGLSSSSSAPYARALGC